MKSSTILPGLAVVLFVISGCGAETPTEPEGAAPGGAEPEPVSAADEAINGFYIKAPIVGAGSGCMSPLAYTITPDGQTFTVYFSEMILQHPTGPTFKKTTCVVGLNLHLPHGLQFSVANIITRGYAHLPGGTYSDQRSTYYFAGHPPDLRAHSRLNGFYDDDYRFVDTFGVASALTSPCGGDAILNIDTSLILNTAGNPTEDAYVDNTTIDGTFQMTFQLGWDHC